MKISTKRKTVLLHDIKPYKNNTKIHTVEQIEKVKISIQNNQYVQPICVDKDNTIVIGHCRHAALIEIYPDKNTEIEVVDLSYLTNDQIKKLRILDNKSNESDWNFDNLDTEIKRIYKNLQSYDPKINTDLGIDNDFYRKIMDGNVESHGDEFSLKSGDKGGIGQMTFILDEEQVQFIKQCMKGIKINIKFSSYKNKNSNGNFLYGVFQEWAQLKKSK